MMQHLDPNQRELRFYAKRGDSYGDQRHNPSVTEKNLDVSKWHVGDVARNSLLVGI
jgi:hypothetical protein